MNQPSSLLDIRETLRGLRQKTVRAQSVFECWSVIIMSRLTDGVSSFHHRPVECAGSSTTYLSHCSRMARFMRGGGRPRIPTSYHSSQRRS